ncbi:unnamed protein product [Linum trigynum]|uniref:Uncharacterized protein n=1 Tax=Linum trigynum TaxID=586398 RepID=A0AAV2E087_9ROSI
MQEAREVDFGDSDLLLCFENRTGCCNSNEDATRWSLAVTTTQIDLINFGPLQSLLQPTNPKFPALTWPLASTFISESYPVTPILAPVAKKLLVMVMMSLLRGLFNDDLGKVEVFIEEAESVEGGLRRELGEDLGLRRLESDSKAAKEANEKGKRLL